MDEDKSGLRASVQKLQPKNQKWKDIKNNPTRTGTERQSRDSFVPIFLNRVPDPGWLKIGFELTRVRASGFRVLIQKASDSDGFYADSDPREHSPRVSGSGNLQGNVILFQL